jgi:tetratricopeptide (TPR) repeat protein
MVARVKGVGGSSLKQLTLPALESTPGIYGLSLGELAGLSLYILGNSYLVRGMETEAVECYNVSLWLYPANARTLFNRAIALARMQQTERAQADYWHAFSIDSSVTRILATIEEIEPLIELDERGVSEPDQQVYLLRRGFATGQEEE